MERTASTDIARLFEQLYDKLDTPDLNRCRNGIRELTDEISTLCMVQATPEPEIFWEGLWLPPRLREVAQLLHRRLGRAVSRDAIASILYGDRDISRKLIDVLICKLRRRLRGTPFTIFSERGVGFAMLKDADPGILRSAAGRPLGEYIPHQHAATWNGVPMSENHLRIIRILENSLGMLVAKQVLLDAFPGKTAAHLGSKIDALREKLVSTGYVIVTQRGYGYGLITKPHSQTEGASS